MTRPQPDHDTDNYVARTKARELRWTDVGTPWTEPVCVIEPVDTGLGSGWGRRPQEVR